LLATCDTLAPPRAVRRKETNMKISIIKKPKTDKGKKIAIVGSF
jgi:hypothetical protein